jgi:hypothetical protein
MRKFLLGSSVQILENPVGEPIRLKEQRAKALCSFNGTDVHNGLKWIFANCSLEEQLGMGL